MKKFIAYNIGIYAIKKSKMEKKKQSSIEWLEQQLNSILKQSNIEIENVIWQQAKAMHKEEIKDAWNDGDYAYFYSIEGKEFEDGDEYYEEKFGSQDEK